MSPNYPQCLSCSQDAKYNTRDDPCDTEIDKEWVARGRIPEGEDSYEQEWKADMSAKYLEGEEKR